MFIYFRIKYQVIQSLLAPSDDSELNNPVIIQRAIHTIFLGLLLIVTSNLVSHVSRFFDSACPYITNSEVLTCYLLVGQEDVFTISGILIILIGLYNFSHELGIDINRERIEYQAYRVPLLILITISIITILYSEHNFSGLLIELLAHIIIVVSVIGYQSYNLIYAHIRSKQNPLIKLRQKLIIISYIFTILFVAFIGYFSFPRANYFPTRTIQVELYMFFLNILTLLLAFSITHIVFLPSYFHSILGIDQQFITKHADFRFDNPLLLSSKLKMDGSKDSNINSDYLLVYEKDEKLLCDMLEYEFDADIVSKNQLSEVIIQEVKLPNSDLIYFYTQKSRRVELLLQYVINEVPVTLNYNGSYVFAGNFKFQSENFEYAVINIIPSLWNVERRVWLVGFHSQIAHLIHDFLISFRKYLEDISRQRLINQILLKFPIKNGNILPIHAISKVVQIPDPEHIEFI